MIESVLPLTVHTESVVEVYVTAPVPEPPVVPRAWVVPYVAGLLVPVRTRVACGPRTVCDAVPELPPNDELPPYVAVRVFAPAVVGVSEQVAVAVPPDPDKVQGELVTVPSETVTVPAGLVVPLAAVTVTPTEIDEPRSTGSGVCDVIAVVVAVVPATIV
jgi:hypothetical protein